MRSRCSSTCAGFSVAWMVWLRITKSNTWPGYSRQIGVGVALHHRQAARHAGIHILLRQFDAASVHALGADQIFQQRAVAAADIQHARAGAESFPRSPQGRGADCVAHATPSDDATAIEKAAHGVEHFRLVQQEGVMALVGLDLDKAHLAATAFSAWAMRLFSTGGNSQSLK